MGVWRELRKEILKMAKRRKRLTLADISKKLSLTKSERLIASVILTKLKNEGYLKKSGKKGRYSVYEVVGDIDKLLKWGKKTKKAKTKKMEKPKETVVHFVIVLPRV